MKKLKTKYYFPMLIAIILLYAVLYFLFIRPLFYSQEYQTKEWITDLTRHILLGVNDPSQFEKINRVYRFLSFWYCYSFMHTQKYTVWVLFNLQNKFTNIIMLNVYAYDIMDNIVIKEQVPLNMHDLKIVETNANVFMIQLGNEYRQVIDFTKNTSTLSIETNKIKYMLDIDIDDYTTNQCSFLPRYQLLGNIVNVEGNVTGTPGDWMSDNPFIGKIRGGSLNYDKIESGGNIWFDNFIGCNNYFLGPYTWFVVLNDDWLIYLLWFDVYDKRDNIGTVKPILIKDRKRDKVLFAGTPGIDCKKAGFPLNHLNYLMEPFTMTYQTNKKMGEEEYDDYRVMFDSKELKIEITSIPGRCRKVFDYDYYKNDVADDMQMEPWDKEYYKLISNLRYVEYLSLVNVTLHYHGEEQQFQARQVIDSMYPKNSLIPTEIRWMK